MRLMSCSDLPLRDAQDAAALRKECEEHSASTLPGPPTYLKSAFIWMLASLAFCQHPSSSALWFFVIAGNMGP